MVGWRQITKNGSFGDAHPKAPWNCTPKDIFGMLLYFGNYWERKMYIWKGENDKRCSSEIVEGECTYSLTKMGGVHMREQMTGKIGYPPHYILAPSLIAWSTVLSCAKISSMSGFQDPTLKIIHSFTHCYDLSSEKKSNQISDGITRRRLLRTGCANIVFP